MLSRAPWADAPDEAGDSDAQAVLTIDLEALRANWRLLSARVAPAECGAAVKADAYGCGIEAAVPALAQAGCRTFFVAHVAEGRRARRALDDAGTGGRILVLNGFHPEAASAAHYQSHQLEPVLGSPVELEAWQAARANWSGARPGAAVHVDTGMNRLGFPPDLAARLSAAELEAAGVTLAMTHLVTAEDPDDPLNARQLVDFARARAGALSAIPASIANSSGIFLPMRPFHALVRPGYALYGGNPTPGAANPMRPVVALHARILQLREVPAGATAGYNGRWRSSRPARLATLGIGYADGLPIGSSGIGEAGATLFVADHPCRVVGRVSMDLTVVDVTDVPETVLGDDAVVEILGPHVGVDELARCAGTIGYQVLTSLGRRFRRRYVGRGARQPGRA